jgi:hypothetical protein
MQIAATRVKFCCLVLMAISPEIQLKLRAAIDVTQQSL